MKRSCWTSIGEKQAMLEQGQDIRQLVENSLQAWMGFRKQVIGGRFRKSSFMVAIFLCCIHLVNVFLRLANRCPHHVLDLGSLSRREVVHQVAHVKVSRCLSACFPAQDAAHDAMHTLLLVIIRPNLHVMSFPALILTSRNFPSWA